MLPFFLHSPYSGFHIHNNSNFFIFFIRLFPMSLKCPQNPLSKIKSKKQASVKTRRRRHINSYIPSVYINFADAVFTIYSAFKIFIKKMQTKQKVRCRLMLASTMAILTMVACRKQDNQETGRSNLTRQTAVTAEEAVKKPGIYEQTYILKEKVYKVDVKYAQNDQGQMVVAPVPDTKDINAFLLVVKGKNYSITEAHEGFGTYILHDATTTDAEVNAAYNKYIAPTVQVNLQVSSQSQSKANILNNDKSLARTTGDLMYFRKSYKQQRAAKTDFAYAKFYRDKDFKGSVYNVTLNGCDWVGDIEFGGGNGIYGEKNYIGNNFNDMTSSFSVDFNDGLGSLTPPIINVKIFQDKNFGGCSREFVFTNPGDPAATTGVNIYNIVMWAVWWAPTQYWNDRTSSYQLVLRD